MASSQSPHPKLPHNAPQDKEPPQASSPSGTQAQYILDLCQAQGFALAGIAPVRPSAWSAHMLAWLEAGKHGTMDYLARDLELRFTPAGVHRSTRSFLVVADAYAARGSQHASQLAANPPKARIARYAQGRDYHQAMKRRLHSLADRLRLEIPGSDFRTCVDTVPIFERELAALAGIGWQAKNTMIIHPRLGSYFLLGVVATTLDLPPTLPATPATTPIADACGTCTRCIDACPTQAITPYSVDASRCISYLTIEHREVIPPEFHAAIGDWIYGCDICQEVCPHNSPREALTVLPHSSYEAKNTHLDLLEVIGWTIAQRQEAFKTSPMKRANLAMMKRNALIVAGNALKVQANPALLDRIKAIAADASEDPIVTTTARDVLASLA